MASRKPFLLRIDPELWADLEAWARDELRSVNGQIEFLLQRASDEKFGKRAERGDDRTAKGRRGSR